MAGEQRSSAKRFPPLPRSLTKLIHSRTPQELIRSTCSRSIVTFGGVCARTLEKSLFSVIAPERTTRASPFWSSIFQENDSIATLIVLPFSRSSQIGRPVASYQRMTGALLLLLLATPNKMTRSEEHTSELQSQ